MREKGLNIYKLSGVPRAAVGAVQDEGKYKYWYAQSLECDNTVAFNYMLSLVNLKICEAENIPLTDEEYTKTLNELDLYIICLEALSALHGDPSDVMRAGTVIDRMIEMGFFATNLVDDKERAANLEQLINKFWDLFNSKSDLAFVSDEFRSWWYQNITKMDYNSLSETEKVNYKKYYQTDKIGAVDSNSERGMAEDICNSGTYFLYLFIGDKEIKKYNSKIQKRYKKEVELYDWCCRMLYGMYSREQVLILARTGVTKYYKKSPEKVIEQLNATRDGGKIGDPITLTVEMILAIVSAVVAVIQALIAAIVSIINKKYQKPDDVDSGIAQDDDWGNRINLNDEENTGNSNKNILLIGGVGILGYYLYSNYK